MRPTHTNYKQKLANFCLFSFAILILLLMSASGWHLQAQSGRKERESQDNTAPSKITRTENKRNEPKELPKSFIVATASADLRHSPYAGYPQQQNFEYLARGGCLVELKGIPGVKVIEDEDVERWEARQTALAEDKAWLIWMELRWDTPTSANHSPFRLRYLLFEPGTGRITASGYGSGIKRTWGTNQRPGSLEEQVRQAGRDIAYQVISELKGDK